MLRYFVQRSKAWVPMITRFTIAQEVSNKHTTGLLATHLIELKDRYGEEHVVYVYVGVGSFRQLRAPINSRNCQLHEF